MKTVWRSAGDVVIVGQAPSRTSDPLKPLESRLIKRRLKALLGVGEVAWGRILKANLVQDWPGKTGKGDAFPLVAARRGAELLLPLLEGKTVLVLGKGTARALGLLEQYLRWQRAGAFAATVVPHPSGVNRWWNEKGNRREARRLLRKVVRTR